ncbi:HD family phosphohydrolase [Kineothrix sedimenti]|uniref:HD family phosphohydrolase n=1 Tax=Kineothrix sedimenti TaxID=3123317 RepID=A0ABZ3EUF9_9FIRM
MDFKERIEERLKSTGREGMSQLLKWMEENGFYEVPCSASNHLAKEGGLAEHSLNVLGAMQDVSFLLCEGPELLTKDQQDAIIICSLLHDLGKTGDYDKPGYVPNMLKGRPTKANPAPEPYQSLSKPYEVNKELSPIDHEIRSIKIASQFINLTEEEELAILWHNGLYGNFKYQIPGKETPLYLLLHFADMWASRVLEKEVVIIDEQI